MDFGRDGRLRRDYLPADLRKGIPGVGIDGVISVQARQTVGETDWLLCLADKTTSLVP